MNSQDIITKFQGTFYLFYFLLIKTSFIRQETRELISISPQIHSAVGQFVGRILCFEIFFQAFLNTIVSSVFWLLGSIGKILDQKLANVFLSGNLGMDFVVDYCQQEFLNKIFVQF